MAFLWDLADHLGTYVTHTQYGTHCMYGSNIRAIWLLRVLDRRSDDRVAYSTFYNN